MDNKKLYGSSILNVDERKISEDTNIFDEMKENYTESEISKMRNELKDIGDSKSNDKVYTDVISGIKSSEKIDVSDKPISEIVDAKEASGKKLSEAGLNLIKNLLNDDPTDDEIEGITSYFSTLISANDIFSVDLIVLKTILGKRISEKIVEVSNKNGVSEYDAITKFINELYKSYTSIIQFNDDVDELYNLVTSISASTNNFKVDDSVSMDSLMEQYKILSDATEKLKKLDERNRRLKNDYKVTDFDILLLDNVKECLDDALSFKRVYQKIDNVNPKKFKKDVKNIDELKQSIGNWINDLKNDPETLYTFPVNDYLTAIQSVDGMVDYIKGFIMLQDNYNAYKEFSDDIDDKVDVTEYFLSKGYVTKKDINNYELSAIVLLYFLSKTFKKKKINTNNDRRILSYTLDIVSKASDIAYASRIMQLVNYYGFKLLNIEPYNYIKTNN